MKKKWFAVLCVVSSLFLFLSGGIAFAYSGTASDTATAWVKSYMNLTAKVLPLSPTQSGCGFSQDGKTFVFVKNLFPTEEEVERYVEIAKKSGVDLKFGPQVFIPLDGKCNTEFYTSGWGVYLEKEKMEIFLAFNLE